MKLSDAKVCAECDELVEKEKRQCPSCTCTQFWYPTRFLESLKERAEVDEARRRLKLLKEESAA